MKFPGALALILSTLGLPDTAVANSCQAGTYLHNTSCRPAELGHYVPGAGATEQIECAPGTYSPALYRQNCSACPKGEYQPNSGEASCMWTSRGHFAGGRGTVEQTACAKGTYQPGTHAYKCDSCPRNHTTKGTGTVWAKDCELIRYETLRAYYDANGDSFPAPGTMKKKPYKCDKGKNWQKANRPANNRTRNPGPV